MNIVQDCSTKLWPKQLGHFNEKDLATLSRDDLFSIKGTSLETCSDCLIVSNIEFLIVFILHIEDHMS